jgi:hypothetical protein
MAGGVRKRDEDANSIPYAQLQSYMRILLPKSETYTDAPADAHAVGPGTNKSVDRIVTIAQWLWNRLDP